MRRVNHKSENKLTNRDKKGKDFDWSIEKHSTGQVGFMQTDH